MGGVQVWWGVAWWHGSYVRRDGEWLETGCMLAGLCNWWLVNGLVISIAQREGRETEKHRESKRAGKLEEENSPGFISSKYVMRSRLRWSHQWVCYWQCSNGQDGFHMQRVGRKLETWPLLTARMNTTEVRGRDNKSFRERERGTGGELLCMTGCFYRGGRDAWHQISRVEGLIIAGESWRRFPRLLRFQMPRRQCAREE